MRNLFLGNAITCECRLNGDGQIAVLRSQVPNMSWDLVQEAQQAYRVISQEADAGRLTTLVTVSDCSVFNIGGDLKLFVDLIAKRDREALREYAIACVDVQMARLRLAETNTLTVSLVDGNAFGGGFEVALTDDVTLAGPRAVFAFPETRFGLWPGMGAWPILSRRIGVAATERLIWTTGITTHTPRDLQSMGLVHPASGFEDVESMHAQHATVMHPLKRLARLRYGTNPITDKELRENAKMWVSDAMSLDTESLDQMRRFAKVATRK